jgi:hypothetical protein
MKHAHQHTHDGTAHSHWHKHDAAQDTDRGGADWSAHKAEPHEHEHTTRQVTVEITFDVGTLDEIGLGGLKVGWADAERDGREYSLTAGAGVGSSLLEASVRGPEDKPPVYAQADIRTMVRALWRQLEVIQDEMATAKQKPEES